jgi:hypothetical protein
MMRLARVLCTASSRREHAHSPFVDTLQRPQCKIYVLPEEEEEEQQQQQQQNAGCARASALLLTPRLSQDPAVLLPALLLLYSWSLHPRRREPLISRFRATQPRMKMSFSHVAPQTALLSDENCILHMAFS